jgi:AraC-like DNA-binding protein
VVVRVVPDACLDVIWRSDGRLQVAGPDTGPAPVAPPAAVSYAGVRFRPGAAPALLGVPASALRGQRVDLAELWGPAEAGRLAERLWAAADPAAALEDAFAERLPWAGGLEPLARPLVAALGRRQGRLRTLAGDLGLSERQLRRRCEAAFGYGPKTLDRVLRFRRFLALVAAGPASLADLALAAGYADQAHLSRECRRLAGATPAALHRP